jgi:hypothetical protein
MHSPKVGSSFFCDIVIHPDMKVDTWLGRRSEEDCRKNVAMADDLQLNDAGSISSRASIVARGVPRPAVGYRLANAICDRSTSLQLQVAGRTMAVC